MNQINHKISRRALFALSGLVTALLITAGNVEAGDGVAVSTVTSEVQVGRYQSVMLQADQTQRDLLSVVITRKLPEHVNTVGQAVASLLEGSGYRLLSADLADPYRRLLFSLPLPEVQRQLGPLTLRQALELLSGPAFRLVVEPAYRLLSFELLLAITTNETDDCANR